MKELVIMDGKERLNLPGTSVEVLRNVAMRFEITLVGVGEERKLQLVLFVKDRSPIIMDPNAGLEAMRRFLRDGLSISIVDTTKE